jgi:hypothetical protein
MWTDGRPKRLGESEKRLVLFAERLDELAKRVGVSSALPGL